MVLQNPMGSKDKIMNAKVQTHSVRPPKIFRHALSDYCGNDIDFTHVYTDDYFKNLLDHGFDSTWLQVAVNDLLPFRETSSVKQKRNLKNLADLAEKAAKFNIGIFLYSCEPRALYATDQFWTRYPEARGEPGEIAGETVYSLCTSTEVVRDRIRETASGLFTSIPALGGAFLITASEHQSHCYSHVIIRPGIVFCGKAEHYGISCPKCGKRKASEVVAEALNCFHDGVEMADTGAQVIAWNWSWSMFAPDPQTDIIKRLKKEIIVMADFERGGYKSINHKKRFIDEYSWSYVGPSQRFSKTLYACKKLRLQTMAKLQLNVTHELATVPNLPLLTNLHKKLVRLSKKDIAGFLGTWNFGCFFTMNTFAVKMFYARTPPPSQDDFVRGVGRDYLGEIDVDGFLKAVKGFSKAFNSYPFYRRFTHYGPVSHALSIPITMKYPGKSELTPVHRDLPRGNDWESCFGPFCLSEIIDLLDKVSKRWKAALNLYTRALFPTGIFEPFSWGESISSPAITLDGVNKSPRSRLDYFLKTMPNTALDAIPELRSAQGMRRLEEWLSAYIAGACLKSAVNLLRANRLHTSGDSKNNMPVLCGILRDEIALTQNLPFLLNLDERLGYHGEAGSHLFNKLRIMRKTALMKTEIDS